MRLRNVKNKKEILENSNIFIKNPSIYKGKWNELFDNSNPIHLEIGCGKGKFLREMARKHPDINFIGVEKSDSILAKCIKQIDEVLPNIIFIQLNAKDIDTCFYKEIACIYLNFSDPWPKKRHMKRRLTSPLFLEKYDFLFQNEKIIIQKTDNQELFEYSIISLSTYGYILEEISLDLHKNGYLTSNVKTEYEERFVSQKMPIYYLKARKK